MLLAAELILLEAGGSFATKPGLYAHFEGLTQKVLFFFFAFVFCRLEMTMMFSIIGDKPQRVEQQPSTR